MYLSIEQYRDLGDGAMKVTPVAIASVWADMTPSEIAGCAVSLIGVIYGLTMLVYLLRKWQREERMYRESMKVLRTGSKRRIAAKFKQAVI